MKREIISSGSDKRSFSISFEQERMWFIEQLSPGNEAYNIRGAIQITGLLNADILEQSINEIVRRHEILRTTFHVVDGQPMQIIGSPFRIELPVIDLQKLSATEREQEVQRLSTQIVQQPFNYRFGPLWRVCWLLLEETQHILVLSMHNIICDGDRSIGIFFREIAALYEAFCSGKKSGLVELPIQYKEYALQQRQQLQGEILKTQLSYWKQQLGDNLPGLQLPTDRPRPAIGTYAGASQELKLSQNISEKLKLLSQQQGVTLFALLLAAFKTLLYRYTRQEDIIVGSPGPGRNLPDTQELIGYFGNPLVLRTDMSGNPTFLQLLSRVAQVISQAYKHQDYPFQKLVESLKLKRDLALTPLFQVLFLLRDDLMPTLELPEFTLTPVDVKTTFVPYDLCIFIKNTDSGLVWTWEYNTDLFEDESIARILKHFHNLLESIVANPEGRIGEQLLLTQVERHQLLSEWNDTKTEYTQTCIHKLVEVQVEKTPSAVAVVWGNQQLTYRELNCRANQLAHYLQKLGVKPEGLVGICVERSPQMMVAILGVLKAGGAYIPLDRSYPKERLEYMLSDANVHLLLTTETLLLASSQIAEIAKNQEIVCLDSDWEMISQQSDENPVSPVKPNNLAYIMYTSGSTGKPKGVMMEHLALSNLIDWHLESRTVGVTTLQFAPLSFDISFHEIFSTWCSLGTLVLVSEEVRRNPEALLNLIVERRIEKLYLPFVALQQLAEVIDSRTAIALLLREVMTAGEQLQITPGIANFFNQTGCTLHNHYGATECQDVTTFTLTGDANNWSGLPPIGRPINNIQTYILDEFFQPVPIGVTGELYIGGDGLARGYFNRPSLTQEKFISNPFGAGRIYKTGDLARYLRDGNIQHLGRADRQVKIRGFRIELGEIEGLLAKHPTVRENAVIATEEISGNKRLIAYVVPVQEHRTSQLDQALRSYLKENLPDYMVPTVIVMLDLPLTPSGKVDRRALPLPDKSRPELEGALVMPQSDTERLIAQVWQEVLQLESVGIHDNFFELGGNSLLLIQVHKKLIEISGAELPTVTLFQYPTIYALAQHLSQTQASKTVKLHKTRNKRTHHHEDIAIIGMSGRFPGAENIDAFWQNLRDGVESISLFSDEEIEIHDLSLLNQPNYVKAGAVLPNIEEFDAEFFGYSGKEAEIMDPQQRIFLECAWEAFENAGNNPKTYSGLVGVYAGSSLSTYLINNVCPNLGFSPHRPFLSHRLFRTANEFQVEQGNGGDHLPMRVSYKLQLTGPSVNVQTTCSTSLVAVHLAIQSLQSGECDMAAAGGISIFVPHKVGYLYQEGMILSPDGHCRAFDAQAKGTVFGNGGGIVVLKRLDEAIANGDNIYAVIKGSAINNDGALKVGYTAPSVEGQAAVISEALAVAEVDASTVSYVETHGTATPLGDPIEIAALTKAFRESTDSQKNGFCAIGSVKTNVGHLDEAAGIAGLIKTVLALQHKSIPPSLHFRQPNPNIDFANSPFYVNTALTEWKTNGTPRRAGVSSFGMGGTNCHIVLEEAPQNFKIDSSSEAPTGCWRDRPLHILTLSAKTDKALEELAQRYVTYLQSGTKAELADICFTANTGREHFNHRLAVVAGSKKQLLEQLVSLVNNQDKPHVQSPKAVSNKQIAFLFTGQGSQYVGMGRQLYETQPTFRQILARCDEILRPYLEQPLLSVLYPDNQSQNLKLDETAYTQPALFVLEYALAQLWKSWGIEPDVIMGHSIGEYVAACIAGVFSLEDGLKLIATRGKLMQALPQDGEMVALLASESQAQEAIAPYSTYVSIAAINAPQSVVISGQREAINAVCAAVEAQGIKTKQLNVSHAFHSPLMEPMLVEFERVARQVNFFSPQIKLISNVTGTLATEEITTPEYWCRHIRQPVRFAASMESLEQQEIDVFVEMGAKPILLGMGRQCLAEYFGLWLPSLRPEREDWQELLNSLAQLYLNGVAIDWVGFERDFTRRRVPLPTYPFQRQRYWLEAPKEYGTKTLALTKNFASSSQHPLLGEQLYLPYLPGTKQIRFQAQIGKNFPGWLKDHRVFETTILPGTAYLEMALAAGVAVTKTANLTLSDVIIRKSLILPENGEQKLVQLVLTPEETLSYSFEIFSLEEDKDQPNWILHASGKLLVRDKELPVEKCDLATLQSKCQQEISVDLLYQRNREQNINYGSSFRAMEQVWRHETIALGKISLPEQLSAQVEEYQLHPVLLDASLQVLDATFLEDDYQNTYVPFGVERLLFYTRPSADIWCYAQLRQGEDRSRKTLSADFRLFTEDGELIAIVEGFQLKHASRDAMLSTTEKSWQDWLYEVEWRPQARYRLLPDYLPTSAEVGSRLQSRLAQLMIHPNLRTYGEAFAHLESVSVNYILTTLQEMGWEFQQGTHFSTNEIAEGLRIVTQHQQLLGRLLEILAEVGILQHQSDRWEVISVPEIEDSQQRISSLSYPEAEAEITLLDRCASNLAQVLRGECDPLQLLFPKGDTSALIKLYQDSPIMQVTNTLVKEAVLSARERLPQGRGLRILEIGSGTGSTTSYLLPHLSANKTEYFFTDIGAFFIAKAQERFKDYPFVIYQVLDIENDPQSQGFEPSHFDLIVAVNVLHATSDLRQTLQHVKQLLAPGGMLVLMEDTAPQRWMDLTFGLTEGWWKFSDRDLRHNYLLLTPSGWRELLRETGFEQVETISTNLEASHPAILLPQETVIVARESAESQISTPRNWLILADTQGTGQQLGEIMSQRGEVCTLVLRAKEYSQIASTEFRINPANPSHFQQLLQAIPTVQGVVHLWSLDAPEILSVTDLEETSLTSCGSTLHLVQALVNNNYTESPCLWLVTRGAQAVNEHHVHMVAQSPLWGMGKVIALEHPELKCVRVDLDPEATGNDAQVLFEEIFSSLSAEGTEDQVAYRSRDRYVPRLVHHHQKSKTLGQTKLDVPENQPFRLEISDRGTLDNLKLQVTTRQKPKAGEIEIKVRTTGLNFRDLLNAMGLSPVKIPLGLECAGEVVALGEGVKGFELGEPAIALASGSFSQYVTTDANLVVPKPVALTFEEAATIPEAFLTAYWCLHHVAKISAGDRVLIHAAAGGVGQAAVQLAIQAGAEVFATASLSKWQVLKSQGVKYIMNSRTLDFAEEVMAYTNGQGVDIVLNSLTGEGFVERSLAVVSAKGRFVELAKLDIWNSEQVAQHRPDVQYFAINMDTACQEQPTLVQSMLRQLIQQFENGSLKPLPQTVFPLQDTVSAFRYMQQAKHIDKIVIKFPDKIGTQGRLSLRSDGTYLITGGLGGLGLLVAQWLVERGAKHLVLLSRSGLNPSASDRLEKLEQAGACVKIVQADVSDSKQLDRVWSEIELSSPPLRGIIHAAGVLDDGVLLKQNWQRFDRVLAPKVQGAWNLHTLTQNQPLDFFVLFSSTTSLLGNAGQANHAAANAFLDALASYRRMLGLPGLSINWGVWAEVGATARMGLVEQLSRKGEESIAPQQGLQVLEQLLREAPVQVGVASIDWSRFLEKQLAISPFFTELGVEIHRLHCQSTAEMQKKQGDSLQNALLVDKTGARPLLLDCITEQVARVLGFSAVKLDREEPLSNLGLDSLMAIEVRNWIYNKMEVNLPVIKIMEGVSISQLAELILEELALTQIIQSAPPSTELDEDMEEGYL